MLKREKSEYPEERRVSVCHIAYQAALILLLCAWAGCSKPPGFEIGGGGITHHPPDVFSSGTEVTLNITLSVWGEGSTNIARRFHNVRCEYRFNSDPAWSSLPMRSTGMSARDGTYDCILVLPASSHPYICEYRFAFVFDGRRNVSKLCRKQVTGGTCDSEPGLHNKRGGTAASAPKHKVTGSK